MDKTEQIDAVTNALLPEHARDELRRLRYQAQQYSFNLLESAKTSLPDNPMFYVIGTTWDCAKSPFGLCAYHVTDRAHDYCVFCRGPEERK